MKDFDADRRKREEKDRSFKIGGETFTYRVAVPPEDLVDWSAMVGGEFTLKDDAGKPVVGPLTPARDADGELKYDRAGTLVLLPGEPVSTLTEKEALEIYEQTIQAFLEPGQEEKWARVRAHDAAHPLNLADMSALVRWLFEEHSGRPTGPSSGSTASTPGDANEQSGTNSTGDSRSVAAPN